MNVISKGRLQCRSLTIYTDDTEYHRFLVCKLADKIDDIAASGNFISIKFKTKTTISPITIRNADKPYAYTFLKEIAEPDTTAEYLNLLYQTLTIKSTLRHLASNPMEVL